MASAESRNHQDPGGHVVPEPEVVVVDRRSEPNLSETDTSNEDLEIHPRMDENLFDEDSQDP